MMSYEKLDVYQCSIQYCIDAHEALARLAAQAQDHAWRQ